MKRFYVNPWALLLTVPFIYILAASRVPAGGGVTPRTQAVDEVCAATDGFHVADVIASAEERRVRALAREACRQARAGAQIRGLMNLTTGERRLQFTTDGGKTWH